MTTTQDIIRLKKPDLLYPILKVLEDRFSPRVFSNAKVDSGDLHKIFEAVRWSPSARNRQPWFFYFANKGGRGFGKLASCLPEYNEWTKEAPLLILACYISEDDFGKNPYALYDLGTAVFSLIIQAQSLGYYVRQVGSFDKDKAKKILKLNKNHQPFILIPMGKIGDYTKAAKEIAQMDFQKRERKSDLASELK